MAILSQGAVQIMKLSPGYNWTGINPRLDLGYSKYNHTTDFGMELFRSQTEATNFGTTWV